ncbi:hypothetical protein QQ045_027020 [Rhodiola kirilowii]
MRRKQCSPRGSRQQSTKSYQRDKKASSIWNDTFISVLVGYGMIPSLPMLVRAGPPEVLSVHLDGCIVGSIAAALVEKAVANLRSIKVADVPTIPCHLEVGYVPLTLGGTYPGLYLFTSPSRFVRPVKNLSLLSENGNAIEFIGPFEQVTILSFALLGPDGGDGGRPITVPATHEEIDPTWLLSVVANLTPWSDHNQSTRNILQCQMGKQTMGFSSHTLCFRADKKLYHLQTETIDLTEQGGNRRDQSRKMFRRSVLDKHKYTGRPIDALIDKDGLPYVGQTINPDEPYCSIYDGVTNSTNVLKLKGTEPAFVDYVAVDGKKPFQKVNIRFRKTRNPIIGDKFSSRHGQKGVCSQLLPDIDMPFSGVTGMRPDLIINPHAFPSRMTIGGCFWSHLLLSLEGKFKDGTPFADLEKKSLVDDLGSVLLSKGFNYHGQEVLYNGVLGTELTCEIFIGPVYYQRLRHMVSDKFQVRSTGIVDQVTRQPIKGKKHGGGIRFGEMERDALLAHGASYLLHDRLHTCSDYHIADVCSECGSILTTTFTQQPILQVHGNSELPPAKPTQKVTCHACNTSKGMETVAMPYVFRYLAAELAAMNIRMKLQLSNEAEEDSNLL